MSNDQMPSVKIKHGGYRRKIDPRHLEHPRFYTKDGWLTPYALACGYIEQKDYGPIRITLFQDGGCYHVQAYDHDQKIRHFWESFRTLMEARRLLQTLKARIPECAEFAEIAQDLDFVAALRERLEVSNG